MLRSSYRASLWLGNLKWRWQRAEARPEHHRPWGWAWPPTVARTGGLALSQTLLHPPEHVEATEAGQGPTGLARVDEEPLRAHLT